MSFITGIPTETLFSNTADGTALATFTAEASLIQGWNGLQPAIPAFFFYNAAAAGKRLRVRAAGVVGSTGTPTYTIFARLGTTLNAVTGTSIAQSAAITTGTTITNQYWELEFDITCRVPGMGTGNSTLTASGSIQSGGFASPFAYPVTPGASASAWTFTIDDTLTQYLMLSASCSVSNALNTIQLKDLAVLGLN